MRCAGGSRTGRWVRASLAGPIQELPGGERRPSVDRAAVLEATRWGPGWFERAEDCRWGRLRRRIYGDDAIKAILSPWPVERPVDWAARVNASLSAAELRRIRLSIERSRPYGSDDWVRRTASELSLVHTIRPRDDHPSRPSRGLDCKTSCAPVSGAQNLQDEATKSSRERASRTASVELSPSVLCSPVNCNARSIVLIGACSRGGVR